MKLDIIYRKGRKDLPACIFIHGLGIQRSAWTSPSRARIMGGLFPLGVLLKSDYKSPLKTLYHDLKALGYTVIAWSQSRPMGPVQEAIKELGAVMDFTETVPHTGIILIGHSRGGCVAAQAATASLKSGKKRSVTSIITLASPHHGSNMARWAAYLSPLASLIGPLVPKKQKGALAKALKRALNFLESKGVRELLPDSDFIKSLGASRPRGVYCLSTGGTNSALVRVNRFFAIPEVFEKIFPDRILPEEMIKGKGDGLVSAASSELPFANEHLNFHVNHAGILVDPEVREAIIGRIRKLT